MNGTRLSLRLSRVAPDGELRGERVWRLQLPRPVGLPVGWLRKALLAAAVLFMVLAPWYFEKIALADWDDRTPAASQGGESFAYPALDR